MLESLAEMSGSPRSEAPSSQRWTASRKLPKVPRNGTIGMGSESSLMGSSAW